MTDRYRGFVITLREDMREDDAEDTLTALRQIKGVLSVDPLITQPEDMIAEIRVRQQLCADLLKVLRP